MKRQTTSEYNQVIHLCKELFKKKTIDYGTAWRILRISSITDQIFIKAQRIRSIQEKGNQKVNDPIVDEFVGIVNYCLIALIQISLKEDDRFELNFEEIDPMYDHWVDATRGLLENKNHDYNEAWRDMRVSSMTDIILMKIYRLKQIEDNFGKTLVSEGIEANYQDMINYAVFCLIKLGYHD
ncbi:nucleotide modification associated domain-containing protein [Aquiflexum sp.]|uniref:nucleotide modification associated domain-containing protein n=1 Tax=Aquiflexum sp. TaxID=1872584 RepID=UPI003593DED9